MRPIAAIVRVLVSASIVLTLAACSDKPRVPEWRLNASGALERFERAWLAGETRAADAEFARARSELTATGSAALVSRAELARCAVRTAALETEPCAGFEGLRADAPAAERAYAEFIEGRSGTPDANPAQLPAQYRAVATSLATGADVDAPALAAIADPVSRLIAAGAVFRAGRATPGGLQVAVDTAAAEGWRRPLLAWLGVQARRAEAAGQADEAARLKRRIALVENRKS